MTGSSATEGGNTERKFPWQLGVGGLAWATLGVTALALALSGSGSASEADAGSVGQLRGSLGESAAAVGGKSGASVAVLVLIGLAALVLTGLLMLGRGWARLALSAVGAISVVYFALSAGVVPTLIAMVVLVVGSLMLLLPVSVNRYLAD